MKCSISNEMLLSKDTNNFFMYFRLGSYEKKFNGMETMLEFYFIYWYSIYMHKWDVIMY